ncbi:MAG TPA: hypothetical protein VGS27_03005 [Candidatus Sulfotelmatobacter sp.]|nr:hypothetical protein [Candidatus Sulfotelmatobacter sp.]HEV2469264.1 hypothetical protein [Candidatus Sulfotelmatobacter sp.]
MHRNLVTSVIMEEHVETSVPEGSAPARREDDHFGQARALAARRLAAAYLITSKRRWKRRKHK